MLAQWRPVLHTVVWNLSQKVWRVADREELMVAAELACWNAHRAGITAPSSMSMTVKSRLIDYVRTASPVKRHDYKRAVEAGSTEGLFPVSLEKPMATDGVADWRTTVLDHREASPEAAAVTAERVAAIQEHIGRLSRREQLIVKRRLADWTFAAIGEELGITESRVCQLWPKIEAKLRYGLKRDRRLQDA